MDTPLRVLIVEDHADDAELLVRELNTGGYQVTAERVDTPETLRSALDKSDWDVVIADYAMNGFTGLDALKIMQAKNLDIPFMLVSGTVGEDLAVEAIKAGASDYLMKDRLARLPSAIAREIRQAEVKKERRKAEKTLRAIFGSVLDGILVADVETQQFVVASDGICRMLGYNREEIGNLGIQDIHPPKDFPYVLEQFQRQAEGEIRLAGDTPVMRRDGSVFYADINTTSVEIDGRTCLVGVFRDITERKRAEAVLHESEERFKTLFEYAPDAYYLHDFEGRFIDGNRAAEEMIGYKKEEVIGKSFLELGLLSPGGLQRAAEFLRENTQGAPTGPAELKLIRKDGKQIFIEIRTFPMAIKGQNVVLGIARDVSERKNLEMQLQQSQKLESIGRLAGGIAHDFNNLLTTIIGNATLILADAVKEDSSKERAEEISAAAERAASLTRQLLAFSRKQVIQPEVLNLNTTVKDIKKILQRMIGEDIVMKTFLSPELGKIEADIGQVEQVIMNIAINARDAMPGGGKLTIRTENIDLDDDYADDHIAVTPGPYVLLSMSDTGMGITKEIQDKIFEPFFTTKEKGKGTGLGLSVVYGIVKQSNGNIWVYSEPGKGTTFKIYLPLVGKKPSKTLKKAIKGDVPKGSETILVVEDDRAVRNLAEKILKGHGYKVLTAANGEEAVELSSNYEDFIHLVLTDVVMPGMNSRDMMERLKSARPEIRKLYMSGYSDDTIVHHGIMDIGNAFIEKPFTSASMGRKVREVLDSAYEKSSEK